MNRLGLDLQVCRPQPRRVAASGNENAILDAVEGRCAVAIPQRGRDSRIRSDWFLVATAAVSLTNTTVSSSALTSERWVSDRNGMSVNCSRPSASPRPTVTTCAGTPRRFSRGLDLWCSFPSLQCPPEARLRATRRRRSRRPANAVSTERLGLGGLAIAATDRVMRVHIVIAHRTPRAADIGRNIALNLSDGHVASSWTHNGPGLPSPRARPTRCWRATEPQ